MNIIKSFFNQIKNNKNNIEYKNLENFLAAEKHPEV